MKNFLIHTLQTSWDEPPRARHQVTNELKTEGRVYFVERNKIGLPRIEVKQAEPNVYVITPYFYLDYRLRYRIAGVNETYYKWLFKKIKQLGVAFDLVMTFDFTAPEIHKHFQNVIFFSADDNVGLGKFTPKFVTEYHTRTERLVAQKAKLCIVTSDYMLHKIKRYNDSTFLVPLGAPAVKQAAMFTASNHATPVLGLVGYLDKNLDYNLLHQLLQQFKIIFVGPISEKAKKDFVKYPNAHFVGVKTGDELYRFLGTMDVCIAPYDVNKINKGSTPNKLWLYLAVGKPVVVTDIPNIKNWKFGERLVYKCDNENFIANCLLAHAENNLELTRQREQLAQNNTWRKRVEEIKQLFYAHREGRVNQKVG